MNLITLFVTWFGAGKSKCAPGTMGSLAALPVAYGAYILGGNFLLVIVSVLLFILGEFACREYLRMHPEKDDPKEVVIDEVAAQCLLLSAFIPSLTSYLIGFLLFRLFDIFKPWPVSLADKHIGGSFGIMFDDLLAAIYPALGFAGLWGLLHHFGTGDALANAVFLLVRV